ncbi:MAG: NAD-binding protein, partial [Pseudolabrys sp.]
LALKTGVDIDLLIKAVAAGSGGSTQFGIRAPMMAQGRFLPAMGTAVTISHYFELIGDLADRAGVATPMLDRAAELYARCIDMGLGEHDNAVMVEVIRRLPRRRVRAKGGKAKPKKGKSVGKAARKRKSRGRKR